MFPEWPYNKPLPEHPLRLIFHIAEAILKVRQKTRERTFDPNFDPNTFEQVRISVYIEIG